MKAKQKAEFDTLVEIQWFLDDNADQLGGLHETRSRTELGRLIEELEADRVKQEVAGQECRRRTAERNVLREKLRTEHLRPIAAIARMDLENKPLSLALACPRARVSDEVLLVHAQVVADAAAEYRQVFLAHTLPDDFVDRLRAVTAGIRATLKLRTGSRLQQSYATARIALNLSCARRAVSTIDALVARRLAGNPGLLQTWYATARRRAPRRIERLVLKKAA